MLLETVEERGNFEQISLALLLIRALDRRWSGTLVVEPPSGHEHVMELKHGLVCRVLVPDGYARLGEIAVEHGIVVPPELDELLDDDGLLGHALTEHGIFDEETLLRALVLQILRRLERVFGLPLDTRWTYGPELTAFEGMPEGVRVDTLRALWAGLSVHGEMGPWLDKSIERIADSPFRVKKGVDLRRFGFTGDARALVRVIRDERSTVGELVARGIAPDEICQRIVYLLAITRYLDFSAEVVASTPPPPPSASAVDELPSISEETLSEDLPSSSEPQPDGSRSASTAPPRRVARIKLRRVAFKSTVAAPDPPGSGDLTTPSSSREGLPSSGRPPSSDSLSDSMSDSMDEDLTEGDRLRVELQSRLARLDGESPFALLGVDLQQLAECSDDEATDFLWECYERTSRKWHPDNCPAEESDLRDGMTRIHDAMSDAFAELCDSEVRAALLAAIEPPAPTQAPRTMRSSVEPERPKDDEDPPSPKDPRRVTMPSFDATPKRKPSSANPGDSAVEAHSKALIALSEQRIDQAVELCRSACRAEPQNPDFQASLLWIRSHEEDANLEAIGKALASLARHHPDHVTASFYRGVVARRGGELELAREAFDRVLDLDPEHVGARMQLAELMWSAEDGD